MALPSNEVPPIVLAVASAVAVSALPVTSPVTAPVRGPANASEVTVPSKKAFLNSKDAVPKSIWSSVTGCKAEAVSVNLAALSTLKSISLAVPKSIAVWVSSPSIKSVANIEVIVVWAAATVPVPNSNALPPELTFNTWPALPIDKDAPIPPCAKSINSPDWNSARPVAVLPSKTVLIGIFATIFLSYLEFK